MGKEWLSWGGGHRSKSSRKGKSSGGGGSGAEREAPTGCMCAVLQLFDLHHLPLASFRPAPFLQDKPTICGGLEAPRNSLELEEPSKDKEAASSLASSMKRQENLNIPVNIQIRTSCESKSSPRVSISKARTDDLLSDCSSSSPGAKTPTLVARLMGLDQLPESSSNAASTLNSLTSSHMHPQAQSQRREQSLVYRRRSCSANNSSRSFPENDFTAGTLSLPETPRISSARRSDAEHRLSLQISNKENIMGEELEFSAYTARKLARRISESRREDENCRRSGHYARQIVKQVKDRVSRKVGLDITNRVMSRVEQPRDDDEHVVLLKPNKPFNNNNKVALTRALVGDDSSQVKQSTPSCSPRLSEYYYYYPKNKPPVVNSTQSAQHSPRLSPLSKPIPQVAPSLQEHLPNHQQNSPAVKKCKKDAIASQKYTSRLKKPLQVSDGIRNKKEEPFVRSATANKGNVADKKCKKTPLSHDLLNCSTAAPTLLPVKKDIPFPATKLVRDKQPQAPDAETWKRRKQKLSSCSSQSYDKQEQQEKEATHILTAITQENIQDDRCRRNGSSTILTSTSPGIGDKAEASVAEYQCYIQRILKRTGIDKSTPVALAKWYSPSRPLDPSIFHYIELFHPTTLTAPVSTSTSPSNLTLRSNRRLVFQLVDELLAEILKPYLCMKPSCHLRPRGQMYGSELIDTLCSRINKFPSANCQVLEDIDALVDADFRLGRESFEGEEEEEEGEEIVSEIERGILESLVHETAMEAAAAAAAAYG
ncbi:uncharacterized protein [Coffea arabica]|uniref:Protein LONGIFOLIA 1-like n=1 Tax=Coffea arabica TaxID=13443 RepID=A0A6P6W789_COFAR|nr:uncharacterized protein LOC113730121 isoform X1 [Coffea arabica]